MKIHKKIGVRLGFGLVLLLSLFGLLFFSRNKAAADTCHYAACSTADITGATFEFQDHHHIVGTFNGKTVLFTDKNPDGDGNHSYQAVDDAFCGGGDHNHGNVEISDWSAVVSGTATVKAGLDVDYYDSANLSQHCQNFGKSGEKYAITVKNKGNVASDSWQWNNDSIISNDGKTTLNSVSSDNLLYGKSADKCGGGIVILLGTPAATSGKQYTLIDHGTFGGSDAASDPGLKKYFPTSGKCLILDGPKNVNIGGKQGQASNNVAIQSVVTANGGQTKTCESSSNIGVEWLVCPALKMMDGIIQSLYEQIQDQLCVPAGLSTTAGGATCTTNPKDPNAGNILSPEVKSAWSIVRTLASVIVVVVMLIMIISEAVGGGVVDAYTIRKVLPRLVMAVIVIQLSWYLCKWAIDLSNDVGNGVAALMKAPFRQGVDSIDAALGGAGSLGVFAGFAGIVGIIIAYIASGITIGGVALIALTVMAAVVVGFAVIVFRKALILISIIFVPLALAALILPGTEKYWKLWRDNFMKLLAMYPLIAMLIAGGHIFGTIAGQASTGISSLIAVLVGFFGPLFFLPKTYKWGGAALTGLSSAIVEGTKGIRNKPKDYAIEKGKLNAEQRKIARAERLAEGEGRRFDSLLSGRFNMALNRETRRHKYRETIEKGRKAGEEEALRQIIGSEYESQDHQDKLVTLRTVAQGHLDHATGIDGRNAAAQRWALDELAKFGDWDIITNLRETGQLDERSWQMFVAKNISAIHQQAPHLSPQRTDLSQISYQDFSTMKPNGIEEWERQFNTGDDRDASTTRSVPSADPAAKRRRMVEQARRALGDDNVLRFVTPEDQERLRRVAEADIRGDEVQVLAGTRTDRPRVVLPDAAALTNPATAPAALRSIDAHLESDDPVVRAATRVQLGEELGGGRLSALEQDALETHVLDLQARAGTSVQARETYNQVVNAAHQELADRVDRAEQQAIAQGLSPTDVANARSAMQAQVDTLRQRFINRGIVPM